MTGNATHDTRFDSIGKQIKAAPSGMAITMGMEYNYISSVLGKAINGPLVNFPVLRR